MRLFLALDLPEPVRTVLSQWREGALVDRDDLRPVPAEALHVTLVFIGSTPVARVGEVWEAALTAASGQSAPRLTAAGVTAIPRRRARLFALDLLDDGDRAGRLHRALAGALAAAGLHEPEARELWPHVTLARVRRGAHARPLDAEAPRIGPFAASTVTLYRSHLSPHGARYEALERLDLGS